MDVNATARAIHLLAALRDCEGSVGAAAAKLGISEEKLLSALHEVGSNFSERSSDGRVYPTPMGFDSRNGPRPSRG